MRHCFITVKDRRKWGNVTHTRTSTNIHIHKWRPSAETLLFIHIVDLLIALLAHTAKKTNTQLHRENKIKQ